MRVRVVAMSLAIASCRDPRDREPPRATEDAAAAEVAAARPVRVEAGAVTLVVPSCEGMSLSILEAALEPQCAVTDAEWNESTPTDGLAQEARREGNVVTFSIVNHGRAMASVPIRIDDRAPGRAFSIVAELGNDAAGIFALPPPIVEMHPADASVHVHSARIRLPPGGAASAKLTIDRRVLRRLDRVDHRDEDAGALPPLPPGPMTLHIGQLFGPLEMGPQAQVPFINELSKR